MSYILEALKKSEKKRPPGAVPDLFTVQGPMPAERPRRPLSAFAAAMAVAALAIGGWAWLGRGDRPVAPTEERPAAPAAPQTVTGSGSREPAAGPVRTGAFPAAAPAPVRPGPAAPALPARHPAASKVPAPAPLAVKAVTPGVEPAPAVSEAPAPAASSPPERPPAPAELPLPAQQMPQAPAPPQPAIASPAAAPSPAPATDATPAPSVPVPAVPIEETPRVAVPPASSQPVVETPAPAAIDEPLPAPVPQETPPADTPPADGRVVDLEALPQDVRASVGKLSVSGHVWSEEPGLRMLTVSDRIVREGQEAAPGVRLEGITQDGAVFTVRGWRFRITGF